MISHLDLEPGTFCWNRVDDQLELVVDIDLVPDWIVHPGITAGEMVCADFSYNAYGGDQMNAP